MRARLAATLVAVALCATAASATATTLSFAPNNVNTLLKVPPGVPAVTITAVGAAGGSGCAPGGHGAAVTATIKVREGDELVGEAGDVGEANGTVIGAAPCPGGAGSGWRQLGYGGMGPGGLGGGGSAGGGASWVAMKLGACCASPELWFGGRPLVVAGGGGGGGYGTGAGGGDAGAVGLPGHAAPGFGGAGGGGGSGSTGGLGGGGGFGSECLGAGGAGWAGAADRGGEGGSAESGLVQEPQPGGGGGGGGGYAGGGGGGGGAHWEGVAVQAKTCTGTGGGGGGSSFVSEGPLLAAATTEPAHIIISYETLPPPLALISTPANGAVYEQGQVVRAWYECRDAPGGTGLDSCGALLDTPSGSARAGVGTPIATDDPGVYHLILNAKSLDGLRSTTVAEYRVVPDGTLAGGGAPVLSGLSQSHRRWREGTRAAHLSGAGTVPVGTSFAFTLNAAAKVRVSFARLAGRGVRSAGSFTVHARRGRRRLSFDGPLPGGHLLSPGDYIATFAAAGPNGTWSRPRRLRFMVL